MDRTGLSPESALFRATQYFLNSNSAIETEPEFALNLKIIHEIQVAPFGVYSVNNHEFSQKKLLSNPERSN